MLCMLSSHALWLYHVVNYGVLTPDWVLLSCFDLLLVHWMALIWDPPGAARQNASSKESFCGPVRPQYHVLLLAAAVAAAAADSSKFRSHCNFKNCPAVVISLFVAVCFR